MPDKLAAALALAGRGFRVFPLRPYGKKPAISGFQHYATLDEHQIKEWWAHNANYNVGVLTTDMVVLDVDVRKGDHALRNFHSAGGHFNTFVVRTATGGYHAYYNGQDSKLAVDLVPGVDVRSHNGYVVGPGSTVDSTLSGEPDVYASGDYEIVSDEQIAWCPPDIEAMLEPPGRRDRRDAHFDLDAETSIANAAVWLEAAEPAIEGQGGDNQTYKVAVKCVRDFALTVETAFDLIANHWNVRCSPPWDYPELYKKIENAAEYGAGNLGTALPQFFFGGVTVLPTPEPEQPSYAASSVRRGNFLAPNSIPPRPWLVERLLLRGEVSLFASPGSGGKSMMILTAACHWAVGKDFGTYKLKTPGVPMRTWLYNAEDDITEQSRRILAVCHTYNLDYDQVTQNLCGMDANNGELCLVSSERERLITNDKAIQFVTESAKMAEADLIVMEPLVNLHACNENNNGEMRFVISTIRRIARECNAAALIAHHTAKGGAADNTGIRGAGAIVNSARVAVMLNAPTDQDCELHLLKGEDRARHVRVDDAKANYFLKSDGAVMWLRWDSQRIANGDAMGVPVVVDIAEKTEREKADIARCLHEHMLMRGASSLIIADAVAALKASDPLYHAQADSTVRSKVDKLFQRPVPVGADFLLIERDNQNKASLNLK